MTVSSRRGSRQMRHWVSSDTLKQISQNLTVSLTFLSVAASRITSSGSAARMWKASLWALFGPIPGSRPSSSIKSWTGPSYIVNSLEGQSAAHAQSAGQRAKLAGSDRLGLVGGVAYGSHNQICKGLGVTRINRFGLDL